MIYSVPLILHTSQPPSPPPDTSASRGPTPALKQGYELIRQLPGSVSHGSDCVKRRGVKCLERRWHGGVREPDECAALWLHDFRGARLFLENEAELNCW